MSKRKVKKNLEWRYKWITALAVIIIALCAFVISVKQLKLSRQVAEEQIILNRLSVKPLLSFYRELGSYEPLVGIRLKNDGLGAAHIDSIQLFYNCESIDNFSDTEEKIIEGDLIFGLPVTPIGQHVPFKDGAYLKDGEDIWLLYIPNEKLTNRKKFEIYLKNIGITIFYSSIYNDPDTVRLNSDCSE